MAKSTQRFFQKENLIFCLFDEINVLPGLEKELGSPGLKAIVRGQISQGKMSGCRKIFVCLQSFVIDM